MADNEYTKYKTLTNITNVAISPTFCFAKWYHSNIYFQTGETHSCYHPSPHEISLEEIKKRPSALHNTTTKIEERRQMLRGQRPPGCQYCWNIEDLGKDLISDREIRTGSLYSPERVEEIRGSAQDFHVNPEYIELSFSNACNFKCGYCHPKASSRYLAEIKQFGPYTQVKNHRCDIDWFKIYEEENNPYIEAWWKWWPDLKKDLKILRLTGGEPLMQKSTYKMLEFFDADPQPHLELNINSNLGSKKEIVDKFIERVHALVSHKKIRQFRLFTSIDTWGPQAEYIRTGLSLEVFEENLKSYLRKTDSPVTLMITFNIFSMFSFTSLLKKISEWRSEFYSNNPTLYYRISFDISYLKEPLQYDVNILPKSEYQKYMDDILEFVSSRSKDRPRDGFSGMELERVRRVYEYVKNTHYDRQRLIEGRRDFSLFFQEQDRRRNTNLIEVFPELSVFWKACQELV